MDQTEQMIGFARIGCEELPYIDPVAELMARYDIRSGYSAPIRLQWQAGQGGNYGLLVVSGKPSDVRGKLASLVQWGVSDKAYSLSETGITGFVRTTWDRLAQYYRDTIASQLGLVDYEYIDSWPTVEAMAQAELDAIEPTTGLDARNAECIIYQTANESERI